jgi:hypothetical protein
VSQLTVVCHPRDQARNRAFDVERDERFVLWRSGRASPVGEKAAIFFPLRLGFSNSEISAEKRENDDRLKELLTQCFFFVPQPLGLVVRVNRAADCGTNDYLKFRMRPAR